MIKQLLISLAIINSCAITLATAGEEMSEIALLKKLLNPEYVTNDYNLLQSCLIKKKTKNDTDSCLLGLMPLEYLLKQESLEKAERLQLERMHKKYHGALYTF